MTNLETIKKLEKLYNVYIERDTFMSPFSTDVRESFKIYAKDGCHWANVIGYRSLIKELSESKESLRRLANLDYLVKREAMA